MALIKNLLDKYRSLNLQLKVVVWFTFAGFLQKGISVITTPIFTRVLSTDDYGLFSVFNAWYNVAVIVATLSLQNGVINNAFIKLKTSHERIVSSFQSLSLTLASVVFVICFVFREKISEFANLPVIVVVATMFSVLFYQPYQLWVMYKRYNYQYVLPVVVASAISVLTPCASVIAIMCIPQNQGVVRVLSFLLVNTVLPGICFYTINYHKQKVFFDKKIWKYALSFNLPLIPHYLSEILLNQIDKIMINIYFGSAEAGIYGVAYSVSSLVLMFTTALNSAFIPWHFQKLNTKSYALVAKVSHGVLLFVAIITLMFMLFAPEIVLLMAGRKYMGAVYLIPTLCLSVFFNYMYQIFSRVELFYEKKLYTVVSTITATIVCFILNLILLPRFGYLSAGVSSLIAHIIFCVLHYVFYRIICKAYIDSVRIYSEKIIFAISCSLAVFGVITMFLYSLFVIRVALFVVLAVCVFLFRDKIKNILINFK